MRPGSRTNKVCVDALKPENAALNRYKDVLPYDDTRVRLAGDGNDYINASHVFYDTGQAVFKYIVAQGPKENTSGDFWQMVWENQVRIIAMVTTLVEKGRLGGEGGQTCQGSISFVQRPPDHPCPFLL